MRALETGRSGMAGLSPLVVDIEDAIAECERVLRDEAVHLHLHPERMVEYFKRFLRAEPPRRAISPLGLMRSFMSAALPVQSPLIEERSAVFQRLSTLYEL
jgi:hypothetical protein